MSKTAIYWCFLVWLLVSAAVLVWFEIASLQSGGWTVSRRTAELWKTHPWWIAPAMLVLAAFAGLLIGHLCRIDTEEIGDTLLWFVCAACFTAALPWGRFVL